MEKANELCKELRKKAGLTLTELCAKVETAPSFISKVENGKVHVSKDLAERYAILFGEQYFEPLTEHLVRYDIGLTLRDILKERNVRITDLAKAFGVDDRYLSPLIYPTKSGRKKMITMNELEELSFFLGVPISKFNPKKVILAKIPSRHLEVRLQNKKEEKPEMKKPTYSYTVDGSGCVKANASSSTDELKAQLKKYASYCDEKDKEFSELKVQYDEEKAHAEFFEKRFRELENQNKLLGDELDEKNKLVEELSSLNASLKMKAETVDYSMAKDLRECTAELTKYKDILLKMLLERYQEEVG